MPACLLWRLIRNSCRYHCATDCRYCRADSMPDFPAIAADQFGVIARPQRLAFAPSVTMIGWKCLTCGAVIGRPRHAKTPALAEAMRPLNGWPHRHEKRMSMMPGLAAEKLKLELSAKAIKADKPDWAKARGPDSRDHLDNLIHEWHQLQNWRCRATPERRYLTNDQTVEKLGELLAANPNGFWCFG